MCVMVTRASFCCELEGIKKRRVKGFFFFLILWGKKKSLFTATTVTGYNGRTVLELPVDEVLAILEERGALRP